MVYASSMYAAFMISTTIGAIDGLCVTFSLYFAVMFKTLQNEIQQIFEPYKDTEGMFFYDLQKYVYIFFGESLFILDFHENLN